MDHDRKVLAGADHGVPNDEEGWRTLYRALQPRNSDRALPSDAPTEPIAEAVPNAVSAMTW